MHHSIYVYLRICRLSSRDVPQLQTPTQRVLNCMGAAEASARRAKEAHRGVSVARARGSTQESDLAGALQRRVA